jgi:hypothetical protein
MLILYLIIYILELWVIVSAVVPVEGDADTYRLVVGGDGTVRMCLHLDNHELTSSQRPSDVKDALGSGTIVVGGIDAELPKTLFCRRGHKGIGSLNDDTGGCI